MQKVAKPWWDIQKSNMVVTVTRLAIRGTTNMSMLQANMVGMCFFYESSNTLSPTTKNKLWSQGFLLQRENKHCCIVTKSSNNLTWGGRPSCSRSWSQQFHDGIPSATSCKVACCPLCCHVYLFILAFVALKVHEVLGHACVSHGEVCIKHSKAMPLWYSRSCAHKMWGAKAHTTSLTSSSHSPTLHNQWGGIRLEPHISLW